MAYRSDHNFTGPKPRIYWLGDGWWRCKQINPRNGFVIGFGRARKPETAYNAFKRDEKWRSSGRRPPYWRR